jgi:hypothetical protein
MRHKRATGIVQVVNHLEASINLSNGTWGALIERQVSEAWNYCEQNSSASLVRATISSDTTAMRVVNGLVSLSSSQIGRGEIFYLLYGNTIYMVDGGGVLAKISLNPQRVIFSRSAIPEKIWHSGRNGFEVNPRAPSTPSTSNPSEVRLSPGFHSLTDSKLSRWINKIMAKRRYLVVKTKNKAIFDSLAERYDQGDNTTTKLKVMEKIVIEDIINDNLSMLMA